MIPAYTMVTRDYIWDTKANSLSVVWVPREAVHTDVFTQLGKILGRVTAREKAAQYLFKEADFLPEGTRPGLSAGVPPGKRAMTIEAGKINGIYGFKRATASTSWRASPSTSSARSAAATGTAWPFRP